MAFNWQESADSGGGKSPKMTEGNHFVKCVKVMRRDKDGHEHISRNGDPQVYSVWKNSIGQECLVVFTLSDAAAGVLATALKCCGADLERMTAAGIDPSRFADEDFASKQLVGRESWASAEKNGEYINLLFLAGTPKESDQQDPPGVQMDDSEDIPFN